MSFTVAVQKIATMIISRQPPIAYRIAAWSLFLQTAIFQKKLIVTVSCGLSPFPTIHMLQSYPECDCIGNRVFREVIKLK